MRVEFTQGVGTTRRCFDTPADALKTRLERHAYSGFVIDDQHRFHIFNHRMGNSSRNVAPAFELLHAMILPWC